MTTSATIKSFSLELTKVISGSPTPVSMACVYAVVGVNGLGYVLALGDTLTNITLDNLGLKDEHAFMNTNQQSFHVDGKELNVFRMGFSDADGVVEGYMMQNDGKDVIATENFSMERHEKDLKT